MKFTYIQDGFIKKLTKEQGKKSFIKLFNLEQWFKETATYYGLNPVDPCCANSGTPLGAPDSIAAGTGGAISTSTYRTNISTDAGGDNFTLANGTSVGQQKKIVMAVDGGGSGTVTPTNLNGGTSIVFDDSGDFVILQWSGAEWFILDASGVIIA